MKQSEIQIGKHYRATVSGNHVTVRVDGIRKSERFNRTVTVFDVTNLKTSKKLVFNSAQRFNREVKISEPIVKNRLPMRETVFPDTKNTGHGFGTVQKPSGFSDSVRMVKTTNDDSPHLIVEARAGTGKTTTLVEGLKLVKGLTTSLIPSPQQKAVWGCMKLSSGKVSTIGFVAFNKSIASELQRKVPQGCDAMTMHSMGFKAIIKALGNQSPNDANLLVPNHVCDITGENIFDLRRRSPDFLNAVDKLVSLCKMNLTDPTSENLARLAAHYDIDLNGSMNDVFEIVPQVLERCKSPKGSINFDDMIWLPIVLNLPIFKYDLLLVDEAQDLNRCQQALAKKAGHRLILCGDPKQAIYGFAGADSESMLRMLGELQLTKSSDGGRGCVLLPLTVTRRCGKAIVREANKIVPDFEAFETNCEGQVVNGLKFKDDSKESADGATQRNYRRYVQDGDMVLCRCNAPLISQCFRFLRSGRKAVIQGRDIGQGLISTIKKMKSENVPDLLSKLSEWLFTEKRKEESKRNPSETRLIAIQDRYDCLCCFCEDVQTIEEVTQKIESIFTDSGTTGVRLSSIHKAKGLEAENVFLLEPEGATVPHPMAKSAWQREQEFNLRYVAITRAIKTIAFVK